MPQIYICIQSILFFFICSFTIAQSPIVEEKAVFTFIYSGPSTIYVDSNCVDTLEWGHPDNPEVIYDGPPGGFLVGFNIQSISGGYDIGDLVPAGEVVSVTYRAHDNMGNDANFSFQITFTDTIKPNWSVNSLPSDLTINCLDDLQSGNPIASDNCSNSSELVYDQILLDTIDECQGGVFFQRYLATDEYGNTVHYDQEVTIVKDTIAPVITAFPQDDSAYCENISSNFPAWVDAQLNNLSATDNSCDSVKFEIDSTAFEQVNLSCGPYTVTFFAEDQCGNQTTTTANYTVLDTSAPTLLVPASDASSSCESMGTSSYFQDWLDSHGGMQVSENCTIIWKTAPENIHIQDVCNDSIEVTFIAEDICGEQVQSTATFHLTDTTAPVFNSPPSNLITACGNQDYLTVAENWLVNIGNAVVEDYCSPDSSLFVQYELNGQLVNLQAVLDSFETSALEGCKDNVMIGGSTYDNVLAAVNITFVVEDLCGNLVRSEDSWLGLIDLQAPTIVTNPQDTTVHCKSLDSLQNDLYQWYENYGGLRAEDDCGTLIYTASVQKDSLWIRLLDSISVSCGFTGSVELEFYANDLCDNQASGPQAVSFNIIDTTAPIVQSSKNILKNCRPGSRDSLITWMDQLAFASIVEDCEGYIVDSFVWQIQNGGNGVGVPNAGPYPDISQIGCSFRVDVTFYLRDACNNSTQFSAFYRLFDLVAPTFINVSDTVTISCGDNSVLDSFQIIDNCVLQPNFSFIDDTTRNTNTFNCDYYNFTIERTYTAEDECGNSAQFTQVLNIVDTLPPEFTNPPDILVQCDEVNDLDITGRPSMTVDACGSPIIKNYTDSTAGSGCTYEVYRTWIVEDECGNSNAKTQLITVSDTIEPLISKEAQDLSLKCSQTTNVDSVFQSWLDSLSAIFTDNCTLEGSFKAISSSYDIQDTSTWPGIIPDSIDYSQCANYLSDTLYSVSMDVLGYDACNNASVSNASFTLLDDVPPNISCPGNIEIGTDSGACVATFNLPVLNFNDACSQDKVEITYQIEGVDTLQSLRPDTFQFVLEKGVYPVSIRAIDCAGNVADCFFDLIIIDQEAPSISCVQDTSYFIDSSGCQKEVQIEVPQSVTDNCLLQDTLEFTYFIEGSTEISPAVYKQYDQNPIVQLNGGFNQVHFVVSDENGNQDTCQYTIIVEDTIAPVAECQPSTVFANPSGVVFTEIDPSLIDGGSSDNCIVDSFWTRPRFVQCQQVGDQINIELFVLDEFGNVDSCSTIIRVEAYVLQPSYEINICDPDTLFLFANAPPPLNAYTFEWTGPNGFTSNQRNPVIYNAGPQNSGTYQLTITGFDNCMAEGSLSININNIATPDLSADNLVNCEGNGIRLISNTFSGDVTYHWYKGLPPNGVLLSSTVAPVFDVNPSPGTHDYYVVVESENCTSNPSMPIEIEVISQPEAIVDTTYIEVCNGATIELEAIDQGQGYEYRWTGPNGFYSTLPSPPVITDADELDEGQYSLVVEAGDCSSEPKYVEVVVNDLPPKAEVEVKDIYCEGEDLIITVTNPTNSDAYFWTSPSGNEYTSQGPEFNFGPVSSSESGLWLVNSEQNGCSAGENTEVLVNVEVLPSIQIDVEGTLCEGDSVTLTATDFENATYYWEGPGLSANGRTVSFIPSTGMYSVTMTSENDCTTSTSKQIEVIEPPTITALSNSGNDCIRAGMDIQLVPTVFPPDSGNYMYQWRGPNNYSSSDSIAIINNAGQEDNGYYVLYVLKQGCPSAPDSTEIRVTRIPEQPEISGVQNYCEGDTISLSTDDPGPGEQSFEWITPDGDTITEVAQLIVPSAGKADSGLYRLVSIVNDCRSPVSDSFHVNIKTVPEVPSISGTSQLCEGDTIMLYPSDAEEVSYEWIFPNTTTFIGDTVIIYNASNTDQGIYRLRSVKDGCASPYSTPYNVQVSPVPQIPSIEEIDQGICLLNENAQFEACIEASSATSGAIYYWYNAENGQLLSGPNGGLCTTMDSLSGFSDGTNSIIVQAELNGCTSTTSIPENITMNKPSSLEVNGGDDMAVCFDDVARLNAVLPEQGSGHWEVVNGNAMVSDPDIPDPEIFNLEVGENLFVWRLSYGFCENYASDTVIVLFDEAPFPENDNYITSFNTRITMDVLDNDDIVGPVRINIATDPVRGMSQVSGNEIVYFPANGFIGMDSFTYVICSVNCPELCDSSKVTVQVGDESLCNIPTIFTPNNDGVNDFFTIQCLSANEFLNNEVVIFNQYGDEVFHAKPYENDWQGTYNGAPLPVGTYYYIVDFGTGRVEKGFVVLER